MLNNLALLAFCVGGGAVFAVGSHADRRRAGPAAPQLPDRFAHSVVPIIVGYVVAHYLTYLVEVGQRR